MKEDIPRGPAAIIMNTWKGTLEEMERQEAKRREATQANGSERAREPNASVDLPGGQAERK